MDHIEGKADRAAPATRPDQAFGYGRSCRDQHNGREEERDGDNLQSDVFDRPEQYYSQRDNATKPSRLGSIEPRCASIPSRNGPAIRAGP